MKELVEVIAKALVDDPSGVVVTEKTEGKTTAVSYTHLDVYKRQGRQNGKSYIRLKRES